MLPVLFLYGWCAILYRPTPSYTTVGAFLYGWLRDPSLCYPSPYTTVGADSARFVYGWCAILYCPTPSSTLLLGPILPVFLRLAARSSTVLPPLHCTHGKCYMFWCDERGRVRRPFTVLLYYTVHGINAASFGAMSVGVLGDPSPCFHPYTTPRLNAACFGAMSVGVLGDTSLCYPVR